MVNNMKKILQDFLDNSSPEQLREELKKGNRPFLQTLKDPIIEGIDTQNEQCNTTTNRSGSKIQ